MLLFDFCIEIFCCGYSLNKTDICTGISSTDGIERSYGFSMDGTIFGDMNHKYRKKLISIQDFICKNT